MRSLSERPGNRGEDAASHAFQAVPYPTDRVHHSSQRQTQHLARQGENAEHSLGQGFEDGRSRAGEVRQRTGFRVGKRQKTAEPPESLLEHLERIGDRRPNALADRDKDRLARLEESRVAGKESPDRAEDLGQCLDQR